MPVSLAQLVRDLTANGLLTADQLQALQSSIPADRQKPGDAGDFARELVNRQVLTAYQARVLYQGRGTGLVYGNYLVLDKLGEGAMGLVFKARHRRMQRIVALKVMSPRAMQSSDAVRRFRREVEAAGRLIHPHIVAAFDADEANGVQFFAMEYVDGTNLAALVKQNGPLPVWQAVHCLIDAARGLEHAHAAGVIHRDIKPANLLMDVQGQVKVLDMGLARIDESLSGLGGGAALTRSGSIMGTIDYMSPEQALDTRHADRRSDVYSLGCTLCFLLTGHAAYSGETLMAIILAHRDAPLPSLQAARDDVPPELETLFHRMIAKRPDDRPQTMGEVADELQKVRDKLGHTSTVIEGDQPTLPIESGSTGAGRKRGATPAVAVPAELQPANAAQSAETSDGQSSAQTLTKVYCGGRTDRESSTRRRRFWAAGAVLGLALLCAPWFWPRDRDIQPDEVIAAPSTPNAAASHDGSAPGGSPEQGTTDALASTLDDAPGTTVLQPLDGWIDLSRRIRLSRDTVSGDWLLQGNTLTGRDPKTDQFAGRLALPVEPTGSYDIAFRFKRTRGDDSVNVVLPVGNRSVTLIIAIQPQPAAESSTLTGLQSIDGLSLLESPATIRDITIVNRRAYRLKIAVRNEDPTAEISVELDDDAVFSWSGAIARLGQTPMYELPDPDRPGVAVTNSTFEFHDLEFRVVSGSATLADLTSAEPPAVE